MYIDRARIRHEMSPPAAERAADPAMVRAAVAEVAEGGKVQERGEAAAKARERAESFMTLAERFAWRAPEPLALVVCGGPATGKSYISGALGARSGLPLLNSDVVRKELAGLAPHERARWALGADVEPVGRGLGHGGEAVSWRIDPASVEFPRSSRLRRYPWRIHPGSADLPRSAA